MTKFVLHAQVYEWYGDEGHIGDPAHGRYKPKGSENFVFEANDIDVYDEQRVMDAFDEMYNKPSQDSFMKYKALSLDYYWPPVKVGFADGKINLGTPIQ